MEPILPILGVVALVALFRLLTLPHTVVRIADGRARVTRGKPPRRLVHDLDDVARRAPDAAGRVEVRGRGASLRLRVTGVGEPLAQRIRNVVLLHRDRLG